MEADALLRALLDEAVGIKQAAAVTRRLLGGSKKAWYTRAQTLKDAQRD
jgi:16S rRNA (cytidine1402-2'-O)-methyltransferase